MRHIKHILILLILTAEISAQVADTIPKNDDICRTYTYFYDEYMVFKDYDKQYREFISKIDFQKIEKYGERSYISTIFKKDGKLKETVFIKSKSKYCDSIALDFANSLEWLPGMQNGKFIDIRYNIPIAFDSIVNERNNSFFSYLSDSDEYEKRKSYFDFCFSDNCTDIINDFDFFYKYAGRKLTGDSLYIYFYEYSRPRKRERVNIYINNKEKDNINYIIYHPTIKKSVNYINSKEPFVFHWNNEKFRIEDNFRNAKRKGNLHLEKNKNTVLIAFIEGEVSPRISIINNITFKNDTTLNLDFKTYKKEELKKELNYSP